MEIINILNNSKPTDWINTLEDEKQRSIFLAFINSGVNEEKISEIWLDELENNRTFDSRVLELKLVKLKDLKESFMDEFVKLVCGDEKYFEERKEFIIKAQNTHKYVVLSIATSLGAKFGFEATVIYPVVTLMLSSVSKIGFNAFCTTQGYPTNK